MDAMPLAVPDPLAPPPDCSLCPRLSALRGVGPGCGPEPSIGPISARLLVVGMAPAAGDTLLAETLCRLGMAHLDAGGLALDDTRITGAVRCAPPQALPEPAEVRACNPFLASELASLPNLRAVLALGALPHAAVLRACGIPATRIRFTEGALHRLPDGLVLADAHHLARYTSGEGRLTPDMFAATVLALLKHLETEA